MTIGKILLELNELSRHTDAILHNAEIGQMFTLLADAIRHANAERLADLDSVFQERNGTTLPDGASDVEEYEAAHAERRINVVRAINQGR